MPAAEQVAHGKPDYRPPRQTDKQTGHRKTIRSKRRMPLRNWLKILRKNAK